MKSAFSMKPFSFLILFTCCLDNSSCNWITLSWWHLIFMWNENCTGKFGNWFGYKTSSRSSFWDLGKKGEKTPKNWQKGLVLIGSILKTLFVFHRHVSKMCLTPYILNTSCMSWQLIVSSWSLSRSRNISSNLAFLLASLLCFITLNAIINPAVANSNWEAELVSYFLVFMSQQ